MIGIFREEVYSPNRVEDDAAILRLTAEALSAEGLEIELVRPQDLSADATPDMTFAMCEGSRCLKILKNWEARGYPVFNSPRAVENCHRYRMLSLVAGTPIPFPKTLLIRTHEHVNGQFDLSRGVWVKRGDVHSTHPNDVRLIHDRSSLEEALQALRDRLITQAVLQEHIHGDLVKFYGIPSRKWFRFFYHKPDKVNGHPFSPEKLQRTAETAAARLGLQVFGGDVVVTRDKHYIIDINSWPSFAICREEAAEQIASFLMDRYRKWESYLGLQRRLA